MLLRYTPTILKRMEQYNKGEYVKYSDYEDILQELSDSKEEVNLLTKSINQYKSIGIDINISLKESVYRNKCLTNEVIEEKEYANSLLKSLAASIGLIILTLLGYVV